MHARLGMDEPISRRDFLNGALLAGAGLLLYRQAPTISPADAFNGYGGIGDYSRSNGNTWDVLSAGHALRDGAFEQRVADAADTGEMYDLVAVGGGISGLAAAIFFQKYKGGRSLVIDNHPIFGGEAKRNEFLVDGQRLTAHQASAIFLVPQKGGYTDRFYEMIGMDRSAFNYQTWRGPSPEMPLAHSPYETPRNYGFYFGPQFGQRPGGGGGVWVMDPWGRKLEGAPISDGAIQHQPRDRTNVPVASRRRWLRSRSRRAVGVLQLRDRDPVPRRRRRRARRPDVPRRQRRIRAPDGEDAHPRRLRRSAHPQCSLAESCELPRARSRRPIDTAAAQCHSRPRRARGRSSERVARRRHVRKGQPTLQSQSAFGGRGGRQLDSEAYRA